MRRMVMVTAALFLAAVAAAQPEPGTGIVSQKVEGRTLHAVFRMPDGSTADLAVSFEAVEGLHDRTLLLTAAPLSTMDEGIAGRLPGEQVEVPPGLGVMLSIRALPDSQLTFDGVATVSVRSPLLTATDGSPLRLFRSDPGGPFEDATTTFGPDGHTVSAEIAGLSDLVLVDDLRPSGDVAHGKFDRLRALLRSDENAPSPALRTQLDTVLQDARGAYDGGDPVAARDGVGNFAGAVKEQGGNDFPNTWYATGGVANLAGSLRAAAATLEFSLDQEAMRSGLTSRPKGH